MDNLVSIDNNDPLTAEQHKIIALREELWQRRVNFEKKYKLWEGDETKPISVWGWVKEKLITITLKATFLYDRGYRNSSKVSINQVKFLFPHISPALHNFKILFLADLHFSERYPEWFIAGTSILQSLKTPVDLILLGGDYRYGYFGPEDFVIPLIQEMLNPIQSTHGIYAVMGNHDITPLKEKLEEIGITTLVNQGVLIQHHDASIWLAGIDDPHIMQCHDVSLAMEGAPDDAFKILLAHSPEAYQEATLWGIDLYLCGHTHGGQIGLPWVGPIYINAKCPRKLGLRKWSYRTLQGYTTTGLGTTDVPVRYNIPPEIVLITLIKTDIPNITYHFTKTPGRK